MEKPLIKVFGERNTGTNYLLKLIDLNLDARLLPSIAPKYVTTMQKWLPGQNECFVDVFFKFTCAQNLGWKHSLVDQIDLYQKIKKKSGAKIHVITLTKNPYTWLLSLYKRPHHYRHKFNFFKHPLAWFMSLYKSPSNYTIKQGTFEEFLRSPWLTVGRENSPKEIENPMILWNIKNASYIQINEKKSGINLRYEDLLLDPEKVLEDIRNVFGLEKNLQKFINLEWSTKGDKTVFTDYQKYYLEEKWKQKLSEEAINIINKYLDDKLLSYYQYEKLT